MYSSNKFINPRNLISILFFIILVLIIFLKGKEVYQKIIAIKPGWLFAGMLCYYINYVFRGIRIHNLSDRIIRKWPNAIRISMLHGFLSYMLPLRTGDMSLPFLIKTESDLKISDGTILLARARLLDLIALGIFTLLAAFLGTINISQSLKIVWIILGFMMIFSYSAVRIISKLSTPITSGILKKILLLGHFPPLQIYDLVLSFFIWTFVGVCLFCTVKAIGLNISFWEVWIVISIQLPLQFIPIQGIANAGNHEGGWVASLSLLGLSTAESLNFAIVSHAVLFSYVLMLSLPLLLINIFFMKENKPV
ncbi:MAG: flippase-like domain-containing protein [Desulfobacteraceae bacterium]|nr:flippase-like domain-containing protein [Desulfobacteraceae bacterium]